MAFASPQAENKWEASYRNEGSWAGPAEALAFASPHDMAPEEAEAVARTPQWQVSWAAVVDDLKSCPNSRCWKSTYYVSGGVQEDACSPK